MLAVICDPSCQNGGICARDDNNKSMCFCPPGYTGEQCCTRAYFSYSYKTILFLCQRVIKVTRMNIIKKLLFLGPSYTPLPRKACYNNTYNRYDNLTEAKAACNLDYGCQAVYDSECNESSDDIYLCPIGTTYENRKSSCIYEKGKIWCF